MGSPMSLSKRGTTPKDGSNRVEMAARRSSESVPFALITIDGKARHGVLPFVAVPGYWEAGWFCRNKGCGTG